MSVELHTAHPLAGSGPTKRAPGPAKPTAPGVLALICERCGKAIRGSGAGYAAVDLRLAAAAMADPNAAKAPWRLVHKDCLPQAIAPLSPHFIVWNAEIATSDALLDAMATLSGHRWFAATDWGSSLVRRILADTDQYADTAEVHAERNASRRAARHNTVIDPGDQRHGTAGFYSNWGCRCDRCKQAWADQRRQQRASTPQSDQQSFAEAVTAVESVDAAAGHTATGARQ